VSRPKKRVPDSARERDQLDLIAHMRASNAKLCEAIVTAFSQGHGKVLAAFGTILEFVATQTHADRR
jgi:hypothetical protein